MGVTRGIRCKGAPTNSPPTPIDLNPGATPPRPSLLCSVLMIRDQTVHLMALHRWTFYFCDLPLQYALCMHHSEVFSFLVTAIAKQEKEFLVVLLFINFTINNVKKSYMRFIFTYISVKGNVYEFSKLYCVFGLPWVCKMVIYRSLVKWCSI